MGKQRQPNKLGKAIEDAQQRRIREIRALAAEVTRKTGLSKTAVEKAIGGSKPLNAFGLEERRMIGEARQTLQQRLGS